MITLNIEMEEGKAYYVRRIDSRATPPPAIA